jgi:hypothetical protein
MNPTCKTFKNTFENYSLDLNNLLFQRLRNDYFNKNEDWGKIKEEENFHLQLIPDCDNPRVEKENSCHIKEKLHVEEDFLHGNKSDEILTSEASNTKESKFKCFFENCGKVYKSKENLNLHIRNIHYNQKPYKCRFCGAVFSHRNGK